MSELAKMVQANEAFAASFSEGDLQIPPARGVAVLTCIDARIDPAKVLGLQIGDAHVLRNAGGRASDDALRSLLISSWLLGTREFAVIHHTDCGMTMFTNDVLIHKVKEEKGEDVSDIDFLTIPDLDQSVRDDVLRIKELRSKLPDGVTVSGQVYDVATGTLREVVPAS
jgi:carbonic anhydrase